MPLHEAHVRARRSAARAARWRSAPRSRACRSRGRRPGRPRPRRARATSRRPCRAPGRTRASSSDSWRTSAPAAAATSAVPSFEAASTTSTWSISPPSDRQPLDDRADRVRHLARGQHDRHRLALAFAQQLERELRVMEGADHRARTMASREPGPFGLPVGLAARDGGRGRGRRGHPRAPPPGVSDPAPRATASGAAARRSTAPGSRRSGRTRPTPWRALGAGTRSSPPAPPAASRWPSTCRCWTRSPPIPRRAPSTSTRPRRWPRTRPASCLRWAAGFLRHAIYDGDTPREERRAIRQRSNLILTNPDMLHVGVLPNHGSWGDVLANLAWIVVDEAHVYRGVFGSHVANVLRRLRRLARAYGAEPRFVLTSATIANPRELGEGLTGLEMLLVDRDGAPHAERQVVMWNPPLVDEQLGKRASALGEAAQAAGGAGGARGAHDLLPQVAPRRGADPALRDPAPGGHGPRRPGRADRALPRRLHAHAAPRDRAAAGRGRPAGGGGHGRAGARHRRGRARRGHLRDVPRHRRQPAPDVGSRRTPRHRARDVRGRARTRWTSSSAATPTSSSTGRWSGRSSTTSPRRSTSPT